MDNQTCAEQTYAVLMRRFNIPETNLFYEHVEAKPGDRHCSYLWPYSGVISAANALAALPGRGTSYHVDLQTKLAGLQAYYDPNADPPGYDSYVNTGGGGCKFHDDNEWLGLEFVEACRTLKDRKYLAKAEEMLRFALSGWSTELGGGISWRQHDDSTRNTCSNGPAAVLALELYQETGQPEYLDWAVRILTWLQRLKSPDSGVYWDSVSKQGDIDTRTFTYNVGTPLHANVLLYTITGEQRYLEEARTLAQASYDHFAHDDQGAALRIFPDTPWFNAILLRGYTALYQTDPTRDRTYIDAMQQNLEYAWEHARAPDGTFSPDWSGRSGVTHQQRWLLDQAAMVELYARLGRLSV